MSVKRFPLFFFLIDLEKLSFIYEKDYLEGLGHFLSLRNMYLLPTRWPPPSSQLCFLLSICLADIECQMLLF